MVSPYPLSIVVEREGARLGERRAFAMIIR